MTMMYVVYIIISAKMWDVEL